MKPDPKKRGYLLPPGCKDLIDLLRKDSEKPSSSPSPLRVNGEIQASEVRVIGEKGEQLGIMSLADALRIARSRGFDLVEIVSTSRPVVCRLVDSAKYQYEVARKKE